jgi:FlaA1/EpsC-like NDP-sugar epimerase
LSAEDIKIEYTGLRPGEKLYEELLADTETTLPTPHPKLRIARGCAPGNGELLAELMAWLQRPEDATAAAVMTKLRSLVQEYRPSN